MRMEAIMCLSLLFLQACFISYSTASGCYIDIANNTNGIFMPLLAYSNKLEPIIPTKGAVRLKRGEPLIIACPDAKNFIEDSEDREVVATCQGNTELKVNNKFLEFEDLRCKRSVSATVKNMHTKCAENGTMLIISYTLAVIGGDIPLIRVCFEEAKGLALYSEHILHGEEIKYAAKSTSRPSFSTEGLPPNTIAAIAYNRNFQKSLFNSLLESSSLAEKYIDSTTGSAYLATGHLAPFADFIYASSQRASNFYINTCPQWQIINNGNWKSVESQVKKTAEAYNKTFQIITGTHDVLKLKNKHGNLVDITFQHGKLPVPKYVWKIMYDKEDRKAITFVVLNNAYGDFYDKPEFCKNICNIYNWGTARWSDFTRGYVFCCDVRDFRKVVSSVPYLDVHGVLQAP